MPSQTGHTASHVGVAFLKIIFGWLKWYNLLILMERWLSGTTSLAFSGLFINDNKNNVIVIIQFIMNITIILELGGGGGRL